MMVEGTLRCVTLRCNDQSCGVTDATAVYPSDAVSGTRVVVSNLTVHSAYSRARPWECSVAIQAPYCLGTDRRTRYVG